MKKLFILNIIIVLCIIMASCGEKTPAIGSGSNDPTVFMTIGGHDVTNDEYRYFYENVKLDFDDNSGDQAITDQAVKTLVRHYAVYDLAKQYNIKFDKEMKAAVDATVTETIESFGGEEGYYAALSESFMTGDCYREILENEQLEMAVRTYLIDDATTDIPADDDAVDSDFAANFVRATHILIAHTNGSTNEENRKFAQELRDRITNGEDFDTLMKEYGQDIGINYKHGYYMTHGLYDEKFESAAYSLEVGEISDVVESGAGFHIVKRLPLETEYLYDNYEDIRYIYKNRVINERLDAIAEGLSVEYVE